MPASVEAEAPAAPAPPTQTQTKRAFVRFRFPWHKTKVGSAGDEEELLVINSTRAPWALHLGYRALGAVAPGERTSFLVVKKGLFSARQLSGDGLGAAADCLTLQITGRIHGVELRYRRLGELIMHDIVALDQPAA